MIDLTPLDVRKKADDFRKVLRGYDTDEVNGFLQLAAERLEELVKENITLRERSERLEQQVIAHEGRERAVQEALVMAQQLREDLKVQAKREAELLRKEAESNLQRRVVEADQKIERGRQTLAELEKRRLRFLKALRSLLQRELEALEVEESKPLEELEPSGRSTPRGRRTGAADRPSEVDRSSPRRNAGDAGARPDDLVPGEDGLWLSSILKEDAQVDGDDESHT